MAKNTEENRIQYAQRLTDDIELDDLMAFFFQTQIEWLEEMPEEEFSELFEELFEEEEEAN